MAGNLMDNACKWARTKVRVRLVPKVGPKSKFHVRIDGRG